MNLLYIVSKKKFDLAVGRYLQNYCRVHFVTNQPAETLFFEANGQGPLDALSLTLPYSGTAPQELPNRDWDEVLGEIECYRLCEDRKERAEIRAFFFKYLRFLMDFIRTRDIDVCLCHERDFLDTACAEIAAAASGCPVFYFSTGFFRGRTLTVAPERIRFTDCDTWEKRLKAELEVPKAADLPMASSKGLPVARPSALSSLLCTVLAAVHPEKRKHLSFLRRKRPFFDRVAHRYRKRRIGKYQQPKRAIEEPFVLVPLQGNEVLRLVPNPLGIESMEHLFQTVVHAVERLNRNKGTGFKVVLKEHPFRPFVIREEFAESFESAVFLRKYDMQELLERASAIVTFNSLAGFEALALGKPVVMLGPLFYRLQGLVHWPESLDELSETIWQALESRMDVQKFERLTGYLRVRYEVEADRRNLTDRGLYNIARKVLAPAVRRQTLDLERGES